MRSPFDRPFGMRSPFGGGAVALSGAAALLATWADSNGGLAFDFTDISSGVAGSTAYGSGKIIDGATPANNWQTTTALTPFDKLTWTGASLRMCYGSDGVLRYAPHNLCLQSETLNTAPWVAGGAAATITANSTTSPIGTSTAEKIKAVSTGNADHFYYQSITVGATSTNTFSVYVKAAEYTWACVAINDGSGDHGTWVDLSSGSLGTTFGTLVSKSITSIGDGWYRVFVTRTAPASNSTPYVGFSNADKGAGDGRGAFAATIDSGIYAWGAQLQALPVHSTDYIPTTSSAVYKPRIDYDPSTLAVRGLLVEEQRVNSALYSQDFSNAAWTKSNVTVSANSLAAPDGTTTADTLTATAGNGTVTQAIATSAVSMTYSVFLKRKTGTGNVDITADGSTWSTQTIDSINWTRCIVTQTASAGTTSPGIRLVTSGDEVYAWGAQYE